MRKYLVLQLQGVMQAWGTHTYEDFRPSSIFPTRSGIVGLIGACLGIERGDIEYRDRLNRGLSITTIAVEPEKIRKIEDFHTVLDARRVNDKPREEAIISRREYLCDAKYYVILCENDGASVSLSRIKNAVMKPKYTPFLGRKSCLITAPLFYAEFSKDDLMSAINSIVTTDVIIYSEEKLPDSTEYEIRDIPIKSEIRQFGKRTLYILAKRGG